MPRFTVQFKDHPSLSVEAADAERAWDVYKVQIGVRRGPLDPAPTITELPPAPPVAPTAAAPAPSAPVPAAALASPPKEAARADASGT